MGKVYDECSNHFQENQRQPSSTRTDLFLGSHVRSSLQMPQDKNKQVCYWKCVSICWITIFNDLYFRSYLILGGSEDTKYGRPGIELNTRSIVIEWKAEWISRMRRFERRASRKCKWTKMNWERLFASYVNLRVSTLTNFSFAFHFLRDRTIERFPSVSFHIWLLLFM